ncbi:MAG: DUF3800 domain-containing protein [Nitrosomonadales bacterium]|nr:DUF3800 domain-containing protein [Nitrosomonadales bacterium]
MDQFHVYIDESCHLEHDNHSVMGMGLIKVNERDRQNLKSHFIGLQKSYKNPTELKWNTLSASRLPLYRALIEAFVSEPVVFRTVLVKSKSNLDHRAFNAGDHDNFYYKLVYLALNSEYVFPKSSDGNENAYRVFLDIKDTRGRERLKTMQRVLNNRFKGQSPFISLQHLRSHDNFWLQLSDFLLGAVTYKARGLHTSPDASTVKCQVIDYLEQMIGYSLDEGTPPWEPKFNIFDFQIKSPPHRGEND